VKTEKKVAFHIFIERHFVNCNRQRNRGGVTKEELQNFSEERGGVGSGHYIFILATFRNLFPEEAILYTVEWEDFHKEII
jgi:hypothetical protein